MSSSHESRLFVMGNNAFCVTRNVTGSSDPMRKFSLGFFVDQNFDLAITTESITYHTPFVGNPCKPELALGLLKGDGEVELSPSGNNNFEKYTNFEIHLICPTFNEIHVLVFYSYKLLDSSNVYYGCTNILNSDINQGKLKDAIVSKITSNNSYDLPESIGIEIAKKNS